MQNKLTALVTALAAGLLAAWSASCEGTQTYSQALDEFCVSAVEFQSEGARAAELRERSLEIVRGVHNGDFVILPGNHPLQVILVVSRRGECRESFRPALGNSTARLTFDRPDLERRTGDALTAPVDQQLERTCVIRVDRIGDFSSDVRSVVGQSGLRRISMVHSNGSLLVGSDDSCMLLRTYVTLTLQETRGRDEALPIRTCPRSAIAQCASEDN
jgi:hypothetical protein